MDEAERWKGRCCCSCYSYAVDPSLFCFTSLLVACCKSIKLITNNLVNNVDIIINNNINKESHNQECTGNRGKEKRRNNDLESSNDLAFDTFRSAGSFQCPDVPV